MIPADRARAKRRRRFVQPPLVGDRRCVRRRDHLELGSGRRGSPAAEVVGQAQRDGIRMRPVKPSATQAQNIEQRCRTPESELLAAR